jgi:hypothetical protein
VIHKIDFTAKNLTSNAGLYLLLENAKTNGIFELIDNDLVFDNESTNKIKMNHIKTMLHPCGCALSVRTFYWNRKTGTPQTFARGSTG